MGRVKSPAIKAPQTTEEASALAERFAVVDAELQTRAAEAQASIAATKAVAEAVMLPLLAELKTIEKQLKPWWAVRHEELTEGKRRSIELGGCAIGYRLSTPKVVFSDGTDDDAAATLRSAEMEEFLRITIAPDKPAILKALSTDGEPGERHDLAARLIGLGFSSKQVDTFFIEPIAAVPAAAA